MGAAESEGIRCMDSMFFCTVLIYFALFFIFRRPEGAGPCRTGRKTLWGLACPDQKPSSLALSMAQPLRQSTRTTKYLT